MRPNLSISLKKRNHDKAVAEMTAKLKARTLGKIRYRLRQLAWEYGVQFVAFRLSITPDRAREMLNGQGRFELEQLSDLALAVGCRLEPKLRRK